jgi:hypothetical protein
MVKDLPDYTIYTVDFPEIYIPAPLPWVLRLRDSVFEKPYDPLVTTYIKEACIIPPWTTVAAPTGMMVSYEGGYMLRALIYKGNSDEIAWAKNCLDIWKWNQNADGSWYQQYYPYSSDHVTHKKFEDRKVDSGAALLAHAMADYDASVGPGSVVYKTEVRKAMQFLYDAQAAFYAAYGKKLISNQKIAGAWQNLAYTADCSECLLSMLAALNQYGTDLTTSGGNSVKTMANDLYEAMALTLWLGVNFLYYMTEYPASGAAQRISYTQALCSQAIHAWYNSAHNTKPNYTDQALLALDYIISVTMGLHGGFLAVPFTGAAGQTRSEYAVYTAFMVIAMKEVDAARYVNQINRGIHFIRACSLRHGEVFDSVSETGRFDYPADTYYGFLAHSSSMGLLSGA